MRDFLLSFVLNIPCLQTAIFYNGASDFFSEAVTAACRSTSHACKSIVFIAALGEISGSGFFHLKRKRSEKFASGYKNGAFAGMGKQNDERRAFP